MPDDFAGFVARERERLDTERNRLFEQRKEIDEKLAAIAREYTAINAYQAAKIGKATMGRGRGAARQSGGRRGSKREGILTVIRENPGGLSRGQILEKMGLKGDKSGEMSVSNALTALSKGNQVRREGGKYLAA